MSKSLGNVIAPQDVMKQSGADILRLWVVASDYAEDLRIGPEILKHMGDAYRRLRNTLRYLLGALAGFSPDETVPAAEMPELERWVLHRLAELDGTVRSAIADYDFHGMFTALHNFCAVDLSAFYFDIRKDRLYCDAADDPARRATRTVMDRTFDCLARWLAPVLCFTAEEAWLARHGDAPDRSIHLELFPEVPAGVARSGTRGALGRIARSAAGRDRRSRSRARRQAHRVEPAGRGRYLRAGAAAAAAARGRSRRAVHHFGRNGARRKPAGGGVYVAGCARDRRRRQPCRRRALRALLAGAAGSRARPGA